MDYEPGIHYPQVQMQSGTTGINSLRIYNPIKQSVDQDSDGEFTRAWVPELAGIDSPSIHTPWLMSESEQRRFGFKLTNTEQARASNAVHTSLIGVRESVVMSIGNARIEPVRA